ncbi:MAG: proline dehydrogenase [Bacteroidetes bacterium GWE2_39_28]|nr:MAG: proline dehydrogenase [Bacteroidetes bacterium GWE2_39_28]OFY12667.1 MAG: proline dehydrogenase [Bacteroidetes bacterium GWF2_39_10]OFZ08203.1 MAG: proline dehydrogenase [Bacteroidetes bacterium RIFOXYB2_FULL_39_7]OFZ10125.1 MAG: proline dehydrogenase [Bacteroidetes bacterium RIFOXYC2_FULL_39_11]
MDFNNTQIAFSMKSANDLRNAKFLFTAISNPVLVKTFKVLTLTALKFKLPIDWIVKPTLYRQFVGGETLNECAKTVKLLAGYNIKSVLDYSVEGGTSEKQAQNAFLETIRSIDFAKGKPSVAYTVFKPTAMAAGDLKTLTHEQNQRFRERFFALCQKAYDNNVRILVDAEHYATQDIIDAITEEAMAKFNKKRAIVFHTLQMYRTDRLEYLKLIHRQSQEMKYIPGIKFVRGAYMDEERKLATELGYDDPINPDKETTDRMYDDGLEYVMKNIDSFELFNGTHNYQSNLLLAELIDKKGIKRDDERIYFSQLYGMSDNISFNLAAEGFNVCKYVPYAPVRDVLPYLLRRAEENTAMAGQTGRELLLINAEISRRKRRA